MGQTVRTTTTTSQSRERGWRAEALGFGRSSRRGGRGLPVGHGLRPAGAQGTAGDQGALDVEGAVGGGVCGDEALHLALSSAERLVGDLGPVVLVNPLFMV